MLHGEAEIEMSDSQVRRLSTGGILLAEDTEGKATSCVASERRSGCRSASLWNPANRPRP
jgi:hypothetical protein